MAIAIAIASVPVLKGTASERFESADEKEMTCQGITVSDIVTYQRVLEKNN